MQLRHNCIIVKNIVPLLKKYMLLSNFRNYVVLKQIISLKLTFNGWVLILTVVCATKNLYQEKSGLVEFSRASRI